MKKFIALLMTALFLTACGGAGEGQFVSISQEEAAELMATREDFILLDVRTPEEFSQSHIPGALNLPVETIGREKPAMLPEEDQLILIYCRSGNRSKQASRKLAQLGYRNIKEFGGINTWTGEIEK